MKNSMGAPALSIVTPSFNVRPFLEECLRSVAAQDSREFEHIVVDGASTDGSVELLSSWARHVVRWVSEPDRGQSNAVNKGFAMARGEILGWLNADDLYEPWTVRHVLQHFGSDDALDLLYGLAIVVDADGGFLRVAPQPRTEIADLYRFTNFLHQPAVFFRRSVIERFGGIDESLEYAMDYDFWLRIARQVKSRFVPDVLARIRFRPGAKMDDPGWRTHYRVSRRLFLKHGGKPFSPMLIERLLNRWIEYPVFMFSWPFRRLLWRLMDVPWGQALRTR
jgi:glycosyltransferase involved in cell wall biosynthesis